MNVVNVISWVSSPIALMNCTFPTELEDGDWWTGGRGSEEGEPRVSLAMFNGFHVLEVPIHSFYHISFAYVDFATPDAKTIAITLSENPLDGRRLLIKDGTYAPSRLYITMYF